MARPKFIDRKNSREQPTGADDLPKSGQGDGETSERPEAGSQDSRSETTRGEE